MFHALLIPIFLSVLINGVMSNERRLLSFNQNDFDMKLQQLQTVVSTLQKSLTEEQLKVQQMNATIAMLQESNKADKSKISALESKVNTSRNHMVGFTACNSQGATLGDHQAIIYDSVITNIGKAYNVNDGEFRAPYAGLYSFTFIGMAHTTSDMYVTLVKNGVHMIHVYSNTGVADSSTATINLHLQIGDAVWVINDSDKTYRLHPGHYNCFSGMLVQEG